MSLSNCEDDVVLEKIRRMDVLDVVSREEPSSEEPVEVDARGILHRPKEVRGTRMAEHPSV